MAAQPLRHFDELIMISLHFLPVSDQFPKLHHPFQVHSPTSPHHLFLDRPLPLLSPAVQFIMSYANEYTIGYKKSVRFSQEWDLAQLLMINNLIS